jgi:uncharacterized protein YeaO (DUF488 family)
MIQVKRAYETLAASDGSRFLVDRIWPRGLKKEQLAVEGWLKDVAPSDRLRKWFGHDPEKWDEFRRRYAAELDGRAEAWRPLLEKSRGSTVTLLYGARDTEHNNAVALREFLLAKAPSGSGGQPKRRAKTSGHTETKKTSRRSRRSAPRP